jgi:hypothetical protein
MFKNGTAYYIHDCGSSWMVISDCFAYGWATGFGLENTGNDRIINCGADGPAGVTATGISIYGASDGPALVTGFQTTVTTGVNSNTSNTGLITAQLVNVQMWGNVATPFNVQNSCTVKAYNFYSTGGTNAVGTGSTLTIV